MGSTISLAGMPNINAAKMYPSNPRAWAKGFKKFAIIDSKLSPLIPIFEKSQIMRPAGSATLIALPRTNKVLSKIERINILPNWGFLYGGSSSTNEDGIPFSIVLESILEINKAQKIPKIMTNITARVETTEAPIPCIVPAINILEIEIRNGNLPLQGTKLLVSIAINFSLGEFIILQPVTPALLQPKPMHMVIICFPVHEHFLKNPSTLNAILGRYPKSSKKVNKGKNIAIGGSITDIIHVRVW